MSATLEQLPASWFHSTLACDGTCRSRVEQVTPRTTLPRAAARLRVAAAAVGWTTTGDADYCPTHRPPSEEPRP